MSPRLHREASAAAVLVSMLTSTFANLASLAATAALVWTVVEERVAGRVPLVSLGRRWFARGRTTIATVAVALIAGVLLVAAPLAIDAARLGLQSGTTDEAEPAGGLLLAGLVTVVVKLALVAFEEVSFRGALLDQLKERLGSAQAVLGTAVMFGLAHAARPGDPSHELVVAVAFLDGIGYAVAALATSSLWTPIAWHAAKNIAVWMLTGTSTLQFAPGLFALRTAAGTSVTDVAAAAVVVAIAAPLVWWGSRRPVS